MGFSPAIGLRDTTAYPTLPANETAAREQIQGRMDEIQDFLNDTMTVEVDAYLAEFATQTVEVNTLKKDGTIFNYQSLKNVIRKINSGENVLIHCVGDSVTLGIDHATVDETFVAVLAQKLANKYPDSTVIRYDGTYADGENTISTWTEHVIQTGTNGQNIIVTRNGIGGNTLMKIFNRPQDYTGVFTSGTLSLKPDLILCMIGVNDSLEIYTTRYVPAEDFKQGLIAFVKQIRNTHPKCDVAYITPTWVGDNTTNVTDLDDYAEAMKEVSYIEGTGLVDVHKLFVDHWVLGAANYGQGDWMTSDDPYHPTAIGHAAIGAEIFNMIFDRATRTEQRDSGISKRVSLLAYNAPDIVRAGTWADNTFALGTTTYHEYLSQTAASTITAKFNGNKVSLLARKNSGLGSFTFTIDGGALITVSLNRLYPTSKADYTNGNQASFPLEKILLSENLTDGIHTLVITVDTGYTAFSGLEIESNIDNSKVPTCGKQNRVINTGKATKTTVTGTSTYFDVVFDQEHLTVPVVTANAGTVGYIVALDVSNITTTGARIYVSKRDGTDFGSVTVVINYISIG